VGIFGGSYFKSPPTKNFLEKGVVMVKIHFGGSRNLSDFYDPQVHLVVTSVIQKGCFVNVGCATGADETIIEAALSESPAHLSVFAQFSFAGEGTFMFSAFTAVSLARKARAQVSYLAGGPLSVPLKARLMRRSKAALKGCDASVFFISQPYSAGSLKVAAEAVKQNIPVYVLPLGFDGQPVPLHGVPGSWQHAQFFGFRCFQWVSGQPLF